MTTISNRSHDDGLPLESDEPSESDERWNRFRRNAWIPVQVIFGQLVGWALRRWLG